MTDSTDASEWLKISDLATRMGCDKSAISRRVARLEGLGLLSTRTDGRSKLVHLAQFNEAVTSTRDAIRELNGRGGSLEPVIEGRDPVLAQEQARKVKIQADLAQIELDKARGELVPVGEVREAMARCAGELVRVLETLPARASELATAIARDGEQGARAVLKEIVRDLRERLAAAMTLLVTETVEEG
jgi:DNA-binding MarR family transcriptional regulator